MSWITVADSNIGGREEQQDRYLLVSSDDGNSHLLAVADGAGGHKMGALAAQAAIRCICDNLTSLWPSKDPANFIDKLIIECNERVLAVGDGDMACTTLVLVFIRGDELFWGHVGDSRFYLIRDSKVIFQTTDHSAGELQKQQAHHGADSVFNASANELYMCLGALPDIAHEVESGLARKGDILLLCSDGLWGQIDMDLVITELSESSLNKENVANCLEKAKQSKQDRSDNITLVAAKYMGEPSLFSRISEALVRPFKNYRTGN